MKQYLIFCLALFPVLAHAQDLHFNQRLETIALGSCNRQDLPQHIWRAVNDQQPDLWVWLGDNIYGDTDDMELMKQKYDKQRNSLGYSQLRGKTPIIGIWDDHDYGSNDGGKEFAAKKASRDLMFDFLDVPKESPAWAREGAFQSYTFGEKGKKVKIILLDARYFRDTLIRQNGRYQMNWSGSILGEKQWQWLENELSDSDADLHLIAGGIQFIATEHRFEKWNNFPKERQRMLDLLVKVQPENAFFLSGDRHISEIATTFVPGYGQIYEFTSSGMTHSYEASTEFNSFRLGKLITKKSFGVIKIDWSGDEPLVKLNIQGDNNELLEGPIPIFER